MKTTRAERDQAVDVVERLAMAYPEVAFTITAEDTREMALRWTYRWELHHLLNLCGLALEAEHSDFVGSAPAYGKELILVARAA